MSEGCPKAGIGVVGDWKCGGWIVAASERCMFGLFVGRCMLMCLCRLCRADERVCLMLFLDDCDALVCKRWRFIIWRMNLFGCGKWWTELAGEAGFVQ
jgi:hypothetical protein